MSATEFVQLHLVPLLAGLLASLSCALPGNFLVLRRQSLLGDAVSHVALAGIVGAFLVTGSLAAWPMMLGAAVAALIAVVLIEAIRLLGRIEPGAAMGAVFTAMFAAGVVLLEGFDLHRVHLDVEHALYGNLESLIWLSAEGPLSLFDPAALAALPPQLPRLAVTTLVAAAFVFVFWKELAISTFDASFAESIGLPARALGFALVALVAVAAVAAFDAVGSIIVIAMFVCPAAAARLMTSNLAVQISWSLVFAALAAVLGYGLAVWGPLLLGSANSVSAAGMMATVSGVILGLACLFGPERRGSRVQR